MRSVPVSVAIPAYRSGPLLRQTLERICACDPLPQEILLHGDGGWRPEASLLEGLPLPVKLVLSEAHVLSLIHIYALHAPQHAVGYELETCVLLSLLLRGADTFVDAGANWGFFTLMALSLPAFNGRCVSFEPHPRSFADLQSLVSQAGLESRVTLHARGLGSRPCGLRLQGGMSDSGCVRLVSEGEGAEVEVTTLDEAVSGNVGVIKMDVEGMEHDVLRGGEKLILEQRPFIILENTLDDEARFRQPIDWLGAMGYRCLVPALFVHSGGTTHLHHYGSPPLHEGARFETDKLAFMPVTELTREWFARQVNLLACPQERLGELPGELHG